MGEGFTRVPNALLDVVAHSASMRNAERCVLLYVLRQSVGFGRLDSGDFGSVAAIARATGLRGRTVQAAISSLRGAGYLQISRLASGSRPASYRVALPDPQITPDLEITPDPQIIERALTPDPQIIESTPDPWITPDPQITPTPDPQITPLKEKKEKNSYSCIDHDLRSRIDTAEIRQALGLPFFVAPAAQPKWAGISQQDPEEVAALVSWAAGTDRPGRAFLGCFNEAGEIRTKRPKQKGHPGETNEERWERLGREAEAQRQKERTD